MADFVALNSMIQMQSQDMAPTTKQAKTRKKSLELPDSPNVKVSTKLLQILKDNEEALLNEQAQLQLQQQQQLDINLEKDFNFTSNTNQKFDYVSKT